MVDVLVSGMVFLGVITVSEGVEIVRVTDIARSRRN